MLALLPECIEDSCRLSLRQDLKETFIDSGVMSAIKEWISPLPDKSLPALRIREELLRILQEVSAERDASFFCCISLRFSRSWCVSSCSYPA